MTAETIIQSLAPSVIARSEAAKQSILSFRGSMDCFASLAMTHVRGNASDLEQRW
jgi:hypothetical protein